MHRPISNELCRILTFANVVGKCEAQFVLLNYLHHAEYESIDTLVVICVALKI